MLVVSAGVSVDVDWFAEEYKEFEPEVELSARLVVERMGNTEMRSLLTGDGRVGSCLSAALEVVTTFGLEKSFIFDFSFGFVSFSGTTGGNGGIEAVSMLGLLGTAA